MSMLIKDLADNERLKCERHDRVEQIRVHRTLTAAQHPASGNHQKFVKIVQGGIAATRVVKPFPTGTKLLQCFFAGHEFAPQETLCLSTFSEILTVVPLNSMCDCRTVGSECTGN